jgi:hypothetical protein
MTRPEPEPGKRTDLLAKDKRLTPYEQVNLSRARYALRHLLMP